MMPHVSPILTLLIVQVRQKTYDLAMTVVMENHLDSIVVDTTATVAKCIEHLKEQKWSPMTFLPLDSITAKPPDQRYYILEGTCGGLGKLI